MLDHTHGLHVSTGVAGPGILNQTVPLAAEAHVGLTVCMSYTMLAQRVIFISNNS